MESCVRAASQLIDKVMNSANKSDARFDGANGSGSEGGNKMHAPGQRRRHQAEYAARPDVTAATSAACAKVPFRQLARCFR